MSGPLAGLCVIDCSKLLPGLYASALLADMGAEVTMVAGPAPDRIARMQLPALMNRNTRSTIIVEACVEPVLDIETALADPQVQARGLVVETATASGKAIRTLGPPWKFARTPAGLRWPGAPPGADGRVVLERLGLAPEESDALAGLGVVQIPGAAS